LERSAHTAAGAGLEDDDAIIESQPGVGEQLRAAREAKGLTLEQVAAETRIPQRHLLAMEAGDFAKLPGRTYSVGFARTYAKTVGLDHDAVAAGVRAQLDAQNDEGYRPASFEPGDPARVPSRALGWFAAFAVLLLLAGGFFFFRTMFAPAGELPSLAQEQRQARQPTAAPQPVAGAMPAANATGPVVFTALVPGIWVKFYDANGRQLLQKQMAQGESFTVPADAQGPLLWTGRPDALAITVGGRPVPKLAEQEQVMKDVPVTAEALLARGQPSPAASAEPAGENPAPAAT
jgi:transcriptional regulator with XRE-family HTH domain